MYYYAWIWKLDNRRKGEIRIPFEIWNTFQNRRIRKKSNLFMSNWNEFVILSICLNITDIINWYLRVIRENNGSVHGKKKENRVMNVFYQSTISNVYHEHNIDSTPLSCIIFSFSNISSAEENTEEPKERIWSNKTFRNRRIKQIQSVNEYLKWTGNLSRYLHFSENWYLIALSLDYGSVHRKKWPKQSVLTF